MMSENVDVLFDAAQAAIFDRQYERAHSYLIKILKTHGEFSEVYFLLARIANAYRNYDKEISLLSNAIDIDPQNTEYLAHLAKVYTIKGDSKTAFDIISYCCSLPCDESLTLDTIGVVFNRLNMYEEASKYFKKAVEKNTNNCGMYFNLGATLKFCGDFSGARNAFENAIALSPHYYKAHAALTSLGGITVDDNHIDRLKALLPGITHSDDLLHICHALSKEYEAIADYDTAYSYLEQGKRTKLESFTYDINDDRATFSALKNHFSANNSTGKSGPDSLGHGLIFIVGMPRTGTTLVERIITNNPHTTTAGELPYIGMITKRLVSSKSNSLIDHALVEASLDLNYEELGRGYLESTSHLKRGFEFLVDKLPLNVLYVGHIVRALPKARIICLDRNPLDTVLSNYRQLFSFADLTYGYSLSLEATAQYYVEFKRLIEFWLAEYPDNFHVVNYESLIKDSHEQARKMIDFCGLPWDESCLKIERNNNPVATASSVQVRDPISDKSIAQWKNYQIYSAEIIEILKVNGLLGDE